MLVSYRPLARSDPSRERGAEPQTGSAAAHCSPSEVLALLRTCASRMAPIHDAIRAFDVDALRSELAAGVSPELDVHADHLGDVDICKPLNFAITWFSSEPERKLEERVACVAALLEAGAAVNAMNYSGTALHEAVTREEFGDIVDLLIAAGADVNAVDDMFGESVVATAAQFGGAAMVKKLISAGARDLDGALVRAVSTGRLRNCAPLLRAGAALPPEEQTDEILSLYSSNSTNPRLISIIRARYYIAKISWTPGGFRGYEREHRRRLTVVFANKFPTLPLDVISHIVLLWAHCGDYDYEGYDPAAFCGNDDESTESSSSEGSDDSDSEDPDSSSASGSDSDSESDDAEE